MIPYNKRQDAQIVKIKDYINGKREYVTGQGTEVTLENTIEAQFTKFDVEGNSVQDGTPSPDNEVPIYSAGDNGSINEVVFNNQMFNKANETVGQFINSSSVVSANKDWNTSEYISVKKGSTICWSYETVGAGQLTINEFNDAKSFIKQTSADYRNNNGNELVVTLLNDTSYVRVGYRNNLTCDNLVLEYGNKRSGFREYKESQTYTIPTQQPFRAIGDIRDTFIKKNNKWYERHYINRLILNGTESWERIGTNTTGKYRFQTKVSSNEIVNNQDGDTYMQGFCNRLIMGTPNTTYLCQTGITNLLGYLIIYNEKETDTFDNFKAWLSSNNLTVDYLLKTPIDIECTETQIQQLENKPSTYKDFTIIQSQDETPVIINAEAVKKLL